MIWIKFDILCECVVCMCIFIETITYLFYFVALKIRLEQRQDFQVEDFEDIAPAIWNQLKSCKNLRFYILPKARPDLVPYLWTEHRDARGNFCEPVSIYSILSI